MTLTTGFGRLAFLLMLLSAVVPARAQADHAAVAPGAEHAEEEETLNAVHHTSDGAYLDFEPMGVLELPRLFLVRRDGALGLDAFASSSAAVASGRYRAEAEEHATAPGVATLPGTPDAVVPDVEAVPGGVVQAPSEKSYDAHLAPADGAEVLADFSISRHLVFIFLGIGVLALLLIPMAGKYKRGVGRTSAPRGILQNMLETFIIYVRDEIARPNLGKKTDKYLPYLLTVFFFILVCNLLGLIPWGATATANITVTAVLAVFTFVVTQTAGTKDYWMHILWPPGIPTFVKFILIPIEIIGLFTKPFALAVRLFANMVAGHLVILNLIGLIFIIGGTFGAAAGFGTAVPAIFLTVFIYALELLVVFIQAYVFTVLSALFIGMASAEHEHDHDHSGDHGPTAHDVAVSHSNGQNVHVIAERTVGTEAVMA